MGDTLQHLNPAVMIILIIFAAWALGSIAAEIRKYACHRKEIELKRDLAERGLNADEIERIVMARPETKRSRQSSAGIDTRLTIEPPTASAKIT